MDRLYTLMCLFQEDYPLSQRDIACRTGFSLGMVNTLLKTMQERNLLIIDNTSRKSKYKLTENGEEFYRNLIREKELSKISIIKKTKKRISKAVILCAGAKQEFPDTPVDLLPLGEDTCNLRRIITLLHELDIKDIILVVGNRKELYYEHFNYAGIRFVENEHYQWSGSMMSLALVENLINDDFLLIENDHIFEKKILNELIHYNEDSCLLMRSMSDDGCDCYVETDKDGNIFRLSKDIRQMNHIDGILVGINRISYRFYKKMLEIYAENKNPLINYEYIIENLSRYYRVPTLFLNDILCWDMNTRSVYDKVCRMYYPMIKKREKEIDIKNLKNLFSNIMDLDQSDISGIVFAGGMTNMNYHITTKQGDYIMRIPGKCTKEMISRSSEKYNSKIAYLLGINVDTVYFNEQEGIKITKYIHHAVTLSPRTARLEENISKTSALMRKLHNSQVELQSTFDVFKELLKYEKMIEDTNTIYYPGYDKLRKDFFDLQKQIKVIGWEDKPCHNDLVAENFIKKSERMYLIDWEYAGKNDPMWDVAAHLLECDFSDSDEELFLRYYFKNQICTDVQRQKILISKILQDVLWTVWTIAKEAKGDYFGSYGIDRMKRAQKNIIKYKEIYEEKTNV